MSCIQPVDPALAQQLLNAAQDCSVLFPTSVETIPPLLTSQPAGPTDLCTNQCAPIIHATSCSDNACSCSAYLTAGASCLECTGTINATARSIISKTISSCFSETNPAVTGTVTSPPTIPCATQCAPIIDAQACTNDACSCPAYLAVGASCLQCTGVLNATASSIISAKIFSCVSASLRNTLTTTNTTLTVPCGGQCSNIIQISTCAGEMCSCTAYLRDGPACYSCTAPFNPSAASILSKDISVCQSNFPALGTAVPMPGPCFSQCAFLSQISAVCGTTNDTCFCPTFVSSGSACSDCYATVNVTYAAILSSGFDICSSEFPSLFPKPTPTLGPTRSETLGSTTSTARSGVCRDRELGTQLILSLVGMGVMIVAFL